MWLASNLYLTRLLVFTKFASGSRCATIAGNIVEHPKQINLPLVGI
jgi:hypothetical protein